MGHDEAARHYVLRVVRVVVLLGAPGSGKTTIGQELGALGLRWRDWEPEIIARWGSREEFIRRKPLALPILHREIRAWIGSDSTPAVLETTGVSDAPMLDELEVAGESFVVRLDVPEQDALERISAREPGRHLTDDIESNRAVWKAFQEHARQRPANLTIDTTVSTPRQSAAAIMAALMPGCAGDA